jgi:hypothetical protein
VKRGSGNIKKQCGEERASTEWGIGKLFFIGFQIFGKEFCCAEGYRFLAASKAKHFFCDSTVLLDHLFSCEFFGYKIPGWI